MMHTCVCCSRRAVLTAHLCAELYYAGGTLNLLGVFYPLDILYEVQTVLDKNPNVMSNMIRNTLPNPSTYGLYTTAAAVPGKFW